MQDPQCCLPSNSIRFTLTLSSCERLGEHPVPAEQLLVEGMQLLAQRAMCRWLTWVWHLLPGARLASKSIASSRVSQHNSKAHHKPNQLGLMQGRQFSNTALPCRHPHTRRRWARAPVEPAGLAATGFPAPLSPRARTHAASPAQAGTSEGAHQAGQVDQHRRQHGHLPVVTLPPQHHRQHIIHELIPPAPHCGRGQGGSQVREGESGRHCGRARPRPDRHHCAAARRRHVSVSPAARARCRAVAAAGRHPGSSGRPVLLTRVLHNRLGVGLVLV